MMMMIIVIMVSIITVMVLIPNTLFHNDSLLNDKSLETTIMENQNTIGYNIGGKILTYAALKSLSLAKVF